MKFELNLRRLYEAVKTTMPETFDLTMGVDRVPAVPCFREARFQSDYEMYCECRGRIPSGKLSHCDEELLCEEIAAYLLMPRGDFERFVADGVPIKALAAVYEVEEVHVKWRMLLADPAMKEPLSLAGGRWPRPKTLYER